MSQSPERSEGDEAILDTTMRLLRGACPERHEILHYAQNDRKRRAQNDRKRRARNDDRNYSTTSETKD